MVIYFYIHLGIPISEAMHIWGFPSMEVPKLWMVYKGHSEKNMDGGTPILGNHHIYIYIYTHTYHLIYHKS